jgi:hypothetical protein
VNSLVRSHRRRGAILGLAIAAFGTVPACQNAPPPGATPATGTPIVRSVEPTVPLPDPAPQTIRLVGLDFRAGLTVTITLPSTTVFDVPSSALQLRSATLLDVSVTLAEPGPYRVVVRNANGFRSDPFDFSVVNELDRRPVVESILPAAVARSTQARTISVTGRNFLLGATIRMTDPLGVIRTLDDPSIVRRSDTALDVTGVFDRQGAYTFVVVNPSGDFSDTMTLTVN